MTQYQKLVNVMKIKEDSSLMYNDTITKTSDCDQEKVRQ